jgi:hypothetical protein
MVVYPLFQGLGTGQIVVVTLFQGLDGSSHGGSIVPRYGWKWILGSRVWMVGYPLFQGLDKSGSTVLVPGWWLVLCSKIWIAVNPIWCRFDGAWWILCSKFWMKVDLLFPGILYQDCWQICQSFSFSCSSYIVYLWGGKYI